MAAPPSARRQAEGRPLARRAALPLRCHRPGARSRGRFDERGRISDSEHVIIWGEQSGGPTMRPNPRWGARDAVMPRRAGCVSVLRASDCPPKSRFVAGNFWVARQSFVAGIQRCRDPHTHTHTHFTDFASRATFFCDNQQLLPPLECGDEGTQTNPIGAKPTIYT